MERDGKTYCDKHTNVETALRCSRCEAYICPSCAVSTPVGYRCKACGSERSATHSLSASQFAIGIVAGAGMGFAAGFLIPDSLGFFILFAAALIGGFVGRAVSMAIGRKSNIAIGALTAIGFLAGSLAKPIAAAMHEKLPPNEALQVVFSNPWPIAFALVAGTVAWGQLR